jgi:hypothetical protein
VVFIDDHIKRMPDDAFFNAAKCKQAECVIECRFAVRLSRES